MEIALNSGEGHNIETLARAEREPVLHVERERSVACRKPAHGERAISPCQRPGPAVAGVGKRCGRSAVGEPTRPHVA
jgi:hypothetical protein